MKSRLALLVLAGALATGGVAYGAEVQAVDTYLAATGHASSNRLAAAAGELAPLNARIVALGAGSAVVYYTYDPDGADLVRVVTTVGTEADGAAAPARFVSYLRPGQRAEVSVAGAVDTKPAALELAYDGGLLQVRSIAAQPEG